MADLPAGYYLIIDTIKNGTEQGHGDAVSDFVVEIVGNKTFTPKATSVPTFDKSIDDSDEGNDGETGSGRIPAIDGLEDGESYEEGTVIAAGDGDVLIIDGTEVDSPFTLNGAGEHTVTVRDGESKNETSYIITVIQKTVQTAPADEINDWRYELDNDNMTISLIQYTNTTKTDVTVYDAYTYNGLTYRTKIASNVSSEKEGGEQYMFWQKSNIESITFCNQVDTSDTTNMSNMFMQCSKLRSLDLSCFDTRKVTDMKYMFYYCTSLSEINVSSFDTSNVTDMQAMFSDCRTLPEIDVTNFNTAKVTNMKAMFCSVNTLTKLDLTSFDTKNVSDMYCMFVGSRNLKNIIVSQGMWSTALADKTNISYDSTKGSDRMFEGCGVSSVTYADLSARSAIEDNIFPTAMAAGESEDDRTLIEDTANTDTTVRYGIGDSVPFKLTAIMPDSISAYETYKLIFHDSMTDGLTYDEESLKVFAGDVEIPAENYMVSSDDGMKSFTVTISDAKAEPFSAVAGTEISVKYSATLNDAAAFRNINNAYLEYSNNPNGEGTGTTVSDDVTAFTFELGIDKVDKDGNALSGAGFTLYKKAADGEGNTEDGYMKIRDEITGGSSFEFTGLAVGDYKLVESTTPDGYNTMEDLEFSVVADSKEDADGNAYVTGLKIVAQGGTLESDMLEGWASDTDTGILSAGITNYKGSELPSTGGMGTMIFYVTGGCIMAVVCFILVKRKEQCAK